MADKTVLLKIRFPSSSPIITKSYKLDENNRVSEVLGEIRESMKHSLAVTSSHGLFLPGRNIWLSDNITLAEIRPLLDKDGTIDLVDRSAPPSKVPLVAYGAIGVAVGVVATLCVKYLQHHFSSAVLW